MAAELPTGAVAGVITSHSPKVGFVPWASSGVARYLEMEKSSMQRSKRNFCRFHPGSLLGLLAIAILLSLCLSGSSHAQQKGQKTFSSPEDAAQALVTATQSNDEAAMLEVLGRDAKRVVASGDDTEDAQSRANFVKRFQQMHRLVTELDGTTTLYVGAENWPTPIPLMKKGNSWYFDTDAGWREILYRRVGENEMSAIRVCQELVAAEKEYYSMQNNEYAQKIYSDEGKKNGLYWKVSETETQSPIGPLVASAVAEGYPSGKDGGPTPYRGYYYQILTNQGKNVAGGAKSYVSNGKMTDGFAFIAYPAEYRSSGVMTFLVSQDGVVLEKDLGKKSDALAKTIREYNPDSSWRKAEEEQQKTASEQKPM